MFRAGTATGTVLFIQIAGEGIATTHLSVKTESWNGTPLGLKLNGFKYC